MKEKGMKWFNFITKYIMPIMIAYMIFGGIFIIWAYFYLEEEYNNVELFGDILKIIYTIIIIKVYLKVRKQEDGYKDSVFKWISFCYVYHLLLQGKVLVERYEIGSMRFVFSLVIAFIMWSVIYIPNIIYFYNRRDREIVNVFNDGVKEKMEQKESAINEKKYYCTNCGKEIQKNWKFCMYCSAKIDED